MCATGNGTFIVFPSRVSETFSINSLFRSILRALGFSGRPFRLPDLPLVYCVGLDPLLYPDPIFRSGLRHLTTAGVHFAREVFKALAGDGVCGRVASKGLPAPDDGVDVKRINLEAVAAAANTLRRY